MSTECTDRRLSETIEPRAREDGSDEAGFRGDLAEVEAAWSESSLRSLERRSKPAVANRVGWPRRVAALFSLGAVITSAVLAYGVIEPPQGQLLAAISFKDQHGRADSPPQVDQAIPTAAGVEAANRFADRRAGVVAFSVVGSDGQMDERAGGRPFVSASVVKAPLLVAELDRLEHADLPLDSTTRGLLTQMITVSDNNAADAIYGRVGDAGLYAVARRADMRDFSVEGYWANAQITADDMAQFANNLDDLLRGPHEDFADELLRSIAPYQRWGIPTAVGERWRVRFKGGWRTTELGALAHQFARLDRDRDSLSLAILTDGQTSHEYATETIRGLTARLLVEPGDDPGADPRR